MVTITKIFLFGVFFVFLVLTSVNSIRLRSIRKAMEPIGRKARRANKVVNELLPELGDFKKATSNTNAKVRELEKSINERSLTRKVNRINSSFELAKLIPDKFVLINNAGQSNGAGRGQERKSDNPFNALCLKRGGNGTSLLPLTIKNSGQVSLQERNDLGNCPMFGFAEMYQSLLVRENGLSDDAGQRKLIFVQTAKAAQGIDDLNQTSKAFFHYKRAITKVGELLEPKQSFLVGATLWTQGEHDRKMSRTEYTEKLIALTDCFNTTAHSLNDQKVDHTLITWQVCSSGFAIALGQLDATSHDQIVLSGPSYQFEYDDAVHINSAGLDEVGALYGLAWKRLYVDNENWEPLRPINSSVFGKTVILTFNKSHLKFDTTVVPEQSNFGFTAAVSNKSVPIKGVRVINSNQVKITFEKTVPQNAVVRYGATSAIGKGPYQGGAGNLRDNQGDAIKFRDNPLHNWCVLFEWEF